MKIMRAAYPEYALAGRIIGGPDWVDSEWFDVAAKAEGQAPRDRIARMVRHLLAERFKLAVHTESRRFDVYALVVARPDRRLGAGLRLAALDCAPVRAASPRTEEPPQSGSDAERCTQRSERGPNGTLRFRAPGFAIDGGLTTLIAGSVDRPIVDRTGLDGRFDIELEYAGQAAVQVTSAGDVGPGTSLFTALQEQLGLKLEPRREMLEVLVIDHVEMPTPN